MFQTLKRITYPVNNMEEARQWYSTFLNTEPMYDSPYAVIFQVGDCSLSITESQGVAGNCTSEIYWEVEDINAVYDRLIELGATPHTPVKSILRISIAKVTDPFGNVLAITGDIQDAEERTVEKKPSETALLVAFCRALAALDEREELRGPDTLADIFLTEENLIPLKNASTRQWAIRKLVSPPLYGFLIARTSYFDAVFQGALNAGIPQIVQLGSGYDTRAYRFQSLLGDTRVFEVDIPTTQNRKVALLKENGVGIPANITYTSLDFQKDILNEILITDGFNPDLEALFIWEGVSYYLDVTAIRATLAAVGLVAAPGSALVFDYMTREVISQYDSEPFRFWLSREDMSAMLKEYGMIIREELYSKDMEQRFLSLKDGSPGEPCLPFFGLISADIKD